jgi:hypothetical protein
MSGSSRLSLVLVGVIVVSAACNSSDNLRPLRARATLDEGTVDIFAKAESYGPNGEIFKWSNAGDTLSGGGWAFFHTGTGIDSIHWVEHGGEINLTEAPVGTPYNGGNIFVSMQYMGETTPIGPGIPADLSKEYQDRLIPQSANIVLTAQADPCYKFARWTGAGNESTDNPYIAPVVSQGEYVGVFVKIKTVHNDPNACS